MSEVLTAESGAESRAGLAAASTAESRGDEERVQSKANRARRWVGILALVAISALHAAVVIGLTASAIGSWRARSAVRGTTVELHPSGDFTHAKAGFLMPARVGPWERVAVYQFDRQGSDFGAKYHAAFGKHSQLLTVASVYVYPAGPGAEVDRYFDDLLGELGSLHGGAKPEYRKNISLAGRFEGRYAFFGYAEPWPGRLLHTPLRSYVVVYGWRSWWVKWRVTTPAPVDAERMKAIVELTETLLPPDDDDAEEDEEERGYPMTARSGS